MGEDNHREDKPDRPLRERARARYSGPSFNVAQLSAGEIADLVSELEVHQIELEIQNEELERTRRELDHAHQKYLDLYDFAPMGYLTVSGKGTITEANLTFCSMTGLTRRDLIGHPLSRLIVAEDRDAYYGLMQTLNSEEREGRLEARMMRTDGGVFWSSFRFVPSPREADGVIHFRAAVNDISEQKAVEKRLQDSEQRFRSLFESAPDFVHLVNTEAVILETNERALRRLGYHHEEFVGRPLDHFFTEESQRRFRENFPGLLERGCYRQEVEVVCKNGETIPVDCQATTVRANDGRIAFCVFVQRDISERKEAERKLAETVEELRRKNEDLRHFTSVIRHDFANPILAIQGFSRELGVSWRQIEQLLEGQQIEGHVKERLSRILREDIGPSLEFIETSAAQMKTLLEGLRQLATVGTLAMKIEPVDMNRLVSHVVGGMKFQIDACGAEVTVEPLPACRGDSARLGQVFGNLLSNAVKYLDDERPGRIRIRGEVRDGKSVYCVEDNGVGMTPGQKERVFDIFYRAQVKGGVHGEGLGLSIAQRLLERLDGATWAESEPGQGSRFFVSLPCD